jgi:hypothetical protein
MTKACSPLLALAVLAFAVPAAAQSSKSTAEALYREGQRLIGENKIPEACARFAESQAQEPAEATLVALAACHERDGKTASAWGEYAEASTKSGPAAEFAKTRAAALEPTLAKIHIDLAPVPPSLELRIDDHVFHVGVIDTDLPIDPGSHRIDATAPGKKPWTTTITIAAGRGLTHVPIALEDVPAPPAPAPVAPAPTDTRSGDLQRPLAIGVAGAGVVLLGVATYYLVNAVSDRSTYDHEPIHRINSRNETWKDISNKAEVYAIVFGALGGAAVGAGAVLFFTDKSQRSAIVPAVAPGYGGLGLVRRF